MSKTAPDSVIHNIENNDEDKDNTITPQKQNSHESMPKTAPHSLIHNIEIKDEGKDSITTTQKDDSHESMSQVEPDSFIHNMEISEGKESSTTAQKEDSHECTSQTVPVSLIHYIEVNDEGKDNTTTTTTKKDDSHESMSQEAPDSLINNTEINSEGKDITTTTAKKDDSHESTSLTTPDSLVHNIEINDKGKDNTTTTQRDDSHESTSQTAANSLIHNIEINYEGKDNTTTTTQRDDSHESMSQTAPESLIHNIDINDEGKDNTITTQKDDARSQTAPESHFHNIEINDEGRDNSTTTQKDDSLESKKRKKARDTQHKEQEEVAIPKRKKRRLTNKADKTKKPLPEKQQQLNTAPRKRKRIENETQVGKAMKKKKAMGKMIENMATRVAKNKLREVREPKSRKTKTARKKGSSTDALVECTDDIQNGVVSIFQDKKSSKPARIFRCTFATMAELCKAKPKISPQHQQAIDETPFGPLLNMFLNGEMNEDKVMNKTALINSIIDSYSVNDDAFRLGSGEETTLVKLTEEDFALIFGLPVRGTNAVLMFDKWKFNLETQREVIKKYTLGESNKISKATMQQIIKQLWEKNDTEFDSTHFARVMIMLTCSTIFYPSSNYDIGKSFIEHIDTLEEMKRLSWAKIFHKHLMDKIKEVKNNDNKDPASVTSCVLVLLVWLCEHTTLIQPRPSYKSGTPRVGRWDLNELGKVYQHGLLQKLTKEQIKQSFSEPTPEEYLLLEETTEAIPLQMVSASGNNNNYQQEVKNEKDVDALKEENDALRAKIIEIEAQNQKLSTENEELRKQKQLVEIGMTNKIKDLQKEVDKFREKEKDDTVKNQKLSTENALHAKIIEIEAQNQRLSTENGLYAKIIEIEAQNQKLSTENEDLRKQKQLAEIEMIDKIKDLQEEIEKLRKKERDDTAIVGTVEQKQIAEDDIAIIPTEHVANKHVVEGHHKVFDETTGDLTTTTDHTEFVAELRKQKQQMTNKIKDLQEKLNNFRKKERIEEPVEQNADC